MRGPPEYALLVAAVAAVLLAGPPTGCPTGTAMITGPHTGPIVLPRRRVRAGVGAGDHPAPVPYQHRTLVRGHDPQAAQDRHHSPVFDRYPRSARHRPIARLRPGPGRSRRATAKHEEFAISHNGRYLAFDTTATNMGLGHDDGQFDLCLRDMRGTVDPTGTAGQAPT